MENEIIQANSAVRRGGGGTNLFYLTSVGSEPMTGSHRVWDGSQWNGGPLGSGVSIYPHPGSSLDNYQMNYVWAIRRGNDWVAIEVTNIPYKVCS